MSRILFISPYYPPEVGAASTHISETAEGLARLGHQVTMLTAIPNYPLGVVPQEYRHGRNRRETRNGVRVVRVRHYITPNKGFLKRILSQLSFGILAPLQGARAVGQPDIMIVVSPPLFTSIAALILSRMKRRPFIFNAADIWPDAAVQLGVLRNPVAIWLAERLERLAYRDAAAVWTVTDGFRNAILAHGVAPEHVFVVPIGADAKLLRPLLKAETRATLGWDDRFTIIHAGTIGLCQELTTLLEAAELLRDERIRIVLVGDGATKNQLMADADRRGLTNIDFLGLQPRDRIPLLIGGADACFCALQDVPLFSGTMPMKAYEAMSCGRPLLLSAEGEARRIAEHEAGAALYVAPENAQALAAAILRLRDEPAFTERLGRQGRAYIEAYYDREKMTEALHERIEALLGKRDVAHDDPVAAVGTVAKRGQG